MVRALTLPAETRAPRDRAAHLFRKTNGGLEEQLCEHEIVRAPPNQRLRIPWPTIGRWLLRVPDNASSFLATSHDVTNIGTRTAHNSKQRPRYSV
jgi:hypothetical protein